jgi:hypothetical protein
MGLNDPHGLTHWNVGSRAVLGIISPLRGNAETTSVCLQEFTANKGTIR